MKEKTIKFRAWETARKFFLNHSQFCESVTPCDGGNKTYFLNYRDILLIDQYAGDKDITGKEIFSGDIINFTSDTRMYANGHLQHNVIMVVGDAFEGFYPVNEPETKNIEILGNIHENPDLIP